MPYFERKPYDEMIADAGASTAAEPVIDVATRILRSETTDRAPIYGPFRCARICSPGTRESLTLSLSADGAPMDLSLHPGDLSGPDGATMSSHAVSVSPDQVEIADGKAMDVTVSVTPPPEAIAGLYSGRIAAEGSEPAIFRVEFEIGTPK